MWFVSELHCKKEVRCQVVYFCKTFLSQNNTDFASSDLPSITAVQFLCRPLLFPKMTTFGKGRVKRFDNCVKTE